MTKNKLHLGNCRLKPFLMDRPLLISSGVALNSLCLLLSKLAFTHEFFKNGYYHYYVRGKNAATGVSQNHGTGS
ncbi:MAG: hypothetical protein K2X27_07955 [Candidatus Obscuribacterales bacterium]|nr:hypothetical protein [Candidatus Obscuribacterales bacterium]